MGAWGEGPFDNDDAADLLAELSAATSTEMADVLQIAITRVLDTEGYLQAPDVSRAVAAAAIVAVLMDPTLPLPAEGGSQLPAGSSRADLQFAREAKAVVDRALDPRDNEWLELWADAGLAENVRTSLGPYVAALSGA